MSPFWTSKRSSRSPGAGSIAAQPVRAVPADQAGVIPLTRSGLHCGIAGGVVSTADPSSSRSPGAGSIAARVSATARTLACRHPAHQERAPLRHRGHPTGRERTTGHPAHQERAPLRPAVARLPGAGLRLSSRSPGAGSIAARPPVRCAGPGACVIPLTRSGLHCGNGPQCRRDGSVGSHPAHQERAPLRPPQHGQQLVDGLSSRSPGAGSIAAGPTGSAAPWARSSHPAHQERAPLRQHVGRVVRRRGARHPAHQERAPLRRRRPLPVPGWCPSHPAHQERAPLRLDGLEHISAPLAASSRSPGAGSIAASSWAHSAPRPPWSSRSPGAGSIAAEPLRHLEKHAHWSSRSPGAGSIAANGA